MKIRVISLLLVAAILLLLLPAPASAATLDYHIEIQEQIRRIRRAAYAYTGWDSFQGYCATWVTWQTYLLGIDTTRQRLNGNQLYDYYRSLDYTSGGYKVTDYPAWQYTLEQALMDITENGTKDAYNILIGIERTPSPDGQLYGHGIFIHAIVDGMVHYSESSGAYVANTYWPEGYPIFCSIAEFVAANTSWVTLDGVIYFGLKSYASDCTAYPANQDAMALENLPVYTQPCTPQTDVSSSQLDTLTTGEIVKVSGLYYTPEQKYWYQIQRNGQTGYVDASGMHTIGLRFDDVKIQGVSGLSVLHRGSGYTLYGNVTSEQNRIDEVQVMIYPENSREPVLSVQIDTDTKSFWLSDKQIREALAVHTLPVGDYELQVLSRVKNYTLENGEVTASEQLLPLWNSHFQVIEGWQTYPVVTFDACGGAASVNQTVVKPGQALETLPEASRPGYTFAGWFTAPEGGEAVTADDIIYGDAVLYARWNRDVSALDGWTQTEEGWQYYSKGRLHSGWLDYAGLRFYIYDDGELAVDWKYIRNQLYYFHRSGALASGWVEIDSVPHYIEQDGTGAEGWKEIDGETYYFSNYGQLHTGWLTEGDIHYFMDADGRPADSRITLQGNSHWFGEDGKLLMVRELGGNTTVYNHFRAELLTDRQQCVQRG